MSCINFLFLTGSVGAGTANTVEIEAGGSTTAASAKKAPGLPATLCRRALCRVGLGMLLLLLLLALLLFVVSRLAPQDTR